MQKRRRTRKLATLYKYGFIGLSLAVLAFIGLVAVQDAPTMTMEEKLKGISCAWSWKR